MLTYCIIIPCQAKTEAEEAQRQLIAALNGLAGLMLLEGGHCPAACARAVETYRLAVHTMEVHKKVSELGANGCTRETVLLAWFVCFWS